MTYNSDTARQHHPPCPCQKMPMMAISFILFAILICTSCSPAKGDAGTFNEQAIDISDYGLFDLGVVDINNDDWLDIFTVNHSGRQSLMLNNGSGAFTDVFDTMKMDQDQQFPGLVVRPDEPKADRPAVFINWVGPTVLIRAHQPDQKFPVRGRVEVLSDVEIVKKQNFDVEVSKEYFITPVPVTSSVIEFSGLGEGFFSFIPHIHALPIQFHFDGITREKILIGPNHVPPVSQDFAINMRDRHGMAWADFNDDGRMDVFITRGGLAGTMSHVPLSFWDELLIGTATRFEDIGVTAGLNKNGCPGRQAAWADYNGDGRLDLYVVCGRWEERHPNQLFKQNNAGFFEDSAGKAGLDIQPSGSFVWIDADLDGDLDLFWSSHQGFTLYKNHEGAFLPTEIESSARFARSLELTVSDYDNDGDLDVFSASPNGNGLFINTEGNFSPIAPTSVGLPEKSFAANWVDYDNDGLVDLHAIPDGIYIQKRKGEFISSSELKITPETLSLYRLTGARVNWFDLDNNGTRDMLMATEWHAKKGKVVKWIGRFMSPDERFGGLDYFWKTKLYSNKNDGNHWLQVQLKGPLGNRPAIGAFVTVQAANGKQLQQVGNADGTHFSQGHYRLYYGLGKNPGSVSLRVDWPDGKSTIVADAGLDHLLKISWNES